MKRFLLPIAVLLTAPATASAATVHVGPASFINNAQAYYSPTIYSFVYYQAAQGEVNRLTITYAEADDGKQTVTLKDPGAVISTGHLCQSLGPHIARCTDTPQDPDNPLAATEARLSDRNDEVHAHGGGPGAGAGTILYGGSGDDLLEGGPKADMIDAGSGRDRLFGRDSGDYLTDGDGDVNDPFRPADSDILDGGEGTDRVGYSERGANSRISVRLPDDPHAGDVGEDDDVRNVEQADSGYGDDRLIGDDGKNALRAGEGDDVVIGHGRADFVRGGPGVDDVRGGHGSDRISPGSGLDRVRCGPGRDWVMKPRAGENLAQACEKVSWTYGPGLNYPEIFFAPNPVRLGSRSADFKIPCPTYGTDDDEFRPCSGEVILHRPGHRKVLGRGHFEPGESVRTTRVRLGRRARRLLQRRHGFVATLRLRVGKLPDFDWTILLRR